MSGEAGVAVTDRMKYGIKPSAVRSETMLHNIKAVNGVSFPLQVGQDIIFEVPALGNGYYCDFSTSYFRMNVQATLTTALGNTTAGNTDGYLRFERGPESMFRRVQIFDASGALLENFENYNDLYTLTELLTNNHSNRSGTGMFHGEGFVFPSDFEVTNTSGNFSGARNLPITYPDLGGCIVAAAYSTSNSSARLPLKSGGFDLNYATGVEFSNTNKTSGTRPVTFQLMSAMFGGASDKYLPMSAINGLRIVFSLENLIGSCVKLGLSTNTMAQISVKLEDPTLFLNMVRVDPTVDAALLSAATGADGMIRVHSQTYQTFQNTITAGSQSWEYIIPIKVSSLKALYFCFSPQSYSGVDVPSDATSIVPVAYAASNGTAPTTFPMRTTWYANNLQSYQFFIDGKPNPASPVFLRTGCSEVISELQRAMHFGHKNGDGQYFSLLASQGVSGYATQNCIFGQEFESFNNKGPVIESGMNTLNSLVTLRLNFNSNASSPYPNSSKTITNADGYSDAVYLKVFALYDAFLTIDPKTGIMRTDY